MVTTRETPGDRLSRLRKMCPTFWGRPTQCSPRDQAPFLTLNYGVSNAGCSHILERHVFPLFLSLTSKVGGLSCSGPEPGQTTHPRDTGSVSAPLTPRLPPPSPPTGLSQAADGRPTLSTPGRIPAHGFARGGEGVGGCPVAGVQPWQLGLASFLGPKWTPRGWSLLMVPRHQS